MNCRSHLRQCTRKAEPPAENFRFWLWPWHFPGPIDSESSVFQHPAAEISGSAPFRKFRGQSNQESSRGEGVSAVPVLSFSREKRGDRFRSGDAYYVLSQRPLCSPWLAWCSRLKAVPDNAARIRCRAYCSVISAFKEGERAWKQSSLNEPKWTIRTYSKKWMITSFRPGKMAISLPGHSALGFSHSQSRLTFVRRGARSTH
jgi:hypothetical protein